MSEGSIYRITKNPDNPYVMVNKGFVNNPQLSWKAKGILLYLLSKPDDWKVYHKDIIKHSTDGRDSVTSGIAELVKYGYIIRHLRREEGTGKLKGYDYDVYEVPTGNGLSGNGLSVNGKSTPTNNELELSNEGTNITMSLEKNTNGKIPYTEIVDILNTCGGKSYKSNAQATRKGIQARWNEGFRVDDFRTVIEKKCRQWKNDKNMNLYLRPSTLFGTKFESYLNEQDTVGGWVVTD